MRRVHGKQAVVAVAAVAALTWGCGALLPEDTGVLGLPRRQPAGASLGNFLSKALPPFVLLAGVF